MNKSFTATLISCMRGKKGKDGNGDTENIKEDRDDETLGKYDIKKRKC